MSAVVDARAMNHLGGVVQAIRPQWDAPGIRTALEKALAGHQYPDVALVAVSSARDPKAATPGVIPTRCANGWMATPNDEAKPRTPTPDTVGDMRCPHCPHWVVRGESHECAPLADSGQTRSRLAEAKAAIARPPDFDRIAREAVEEMNALTADEVRELQASRADERPVEDVELPEEGQ